MCIYNLLDNRLGCKTSTSARWGVYTIIFTASLTFLAFALSFYAVYYVGHPAGCAVVLSYWLISAITFGVIGIGLLILTIGYGVHLYRSKDLEDKTQRRLDSIDQNIIAQRKENKRGFDTLALLASETNKILRQLVSNKEMEGDKKKPE
jgi:hypothetical protein